MNFRTIWSSVVLMSLGLVSTSATAQQVPMRPQQQQQAQTEVSDAQLEKFVAASQDLSAIQQSMQQEMMATVQEEGLDMKKFQEMAAQKQNPNKETTVEITAEDEQAYQNAMKEVQSMQMEMQQEMQATVTENGLNVQEFQQIQQAYRQDPDLQAKVQQMLQQGQN